MEESTLEENIKENEIKTRYNGWVRLEAYREGYVVAIKEFQGICVLVSNFSNHSIHGYRISDIEKDEGDWNYIFNENLLEIIYGEIELEIALKKYHLTSSEISEVLNFDFDNRSSESYQKQSEKISDFIESKKYKN